LARHNLRVSMGIKVTFKDGLFEPLKDVKGVPPWQTYTGFSDEELKRDHSESEQRELIVGHSVQQRLLVVSFTDRQPRTRIISAREATAHERRNYEENGPKTTA